MAIWGLLWILLELNRQSCPVLSDFSEQKKLHEADFYRIKVERKMYANQTRKKNEKLNKRKILYLKWNKLFRSGNQSNRLWQFERFGSNYELNNNNDDWNRITQHPKRY